MFQWNWRYCCQHTCKQHLNRSTYIHKDKENGFLQTNFIEPRGPAVNGDVHLLKSEEHDKPIVPRSFMGLRK